MSTAQSRRTFLATAAAGAGLLACSRRLPAQRRPNVILLLADDLGYADLGCQGCRDIATPAIDALATGGVRCTDGHSNHPVCAPTRAALLSGQYQHRFGFEHNPGPAEQADAAFGLPREVPLLPERLKAAGYATGMVGKWHVGFREGLRPHERGFDSYFGFLGGARSYYPDNPKADPLVRNGEPVTAEREYLTDAFAREAVSFIETHRREPFFLYVAFNAVHGPLEAARAYEARCAGITDPKRRTYAAMLTALDDAVGRIVGSLDRHGLRQDTLVLFMSDNGGPTPQTTSRNDPLRGFKGQVYEGGIRVPYLLNWPGRLPAGQVYGAPVAGFDLHATALAAAGVSVAPGQAIDGVSLLPFVSGSPTAVPHEQLCWRAGTQHAVRQGDWKLLQLPGGPPELYNLATDLGEQTNLAAREPARLAALQAAYTAWDQQMAAPRWKRHDGRGQGGLGQRFKQLDQDGDGRLTRDEVRQQELFDRADADHDGVVTQREARAWRAADPDDE
ncbi:MAG: sulfatase-like hydrolase/transferase [Fimbriimonadaceae bacterium]|nr:sulfatase-like hydrolase/transferase [Fimbriimonadaceae bacterium]